MDIDLGPVSSFERLPALVEIGTGFFYLTRQRKKWVLLSTLCPHQGGEVLWEESTCEFVCPLHGWRFDACGKTDPGNPALRTYRVKEVQGRLWAKVTV
ncbi:MAG: Rieske (2Fe-2S) protein [Kiritimatiellae bacterium]|nr:Rieske (2Fe-2S) protein [Kiritimatiellia bacterium]